MARLRVNPTRMVMNDLQKRLGIAQQGHRLLKEKQDSLIREFMIVYDDAVVLRKQIQLDYQQLQQHFDLATIEMDTDDVQKSLIGDDAVMRVREDVKTRFGVSVPEYHLRDTSVPKQNDDYLLTRHYRIDRINARKAKFQQQLIDLATLEKSCFVLAGEIKGTRRRVNALEHRTIPDIKETLIYIRLRIDDQTRSQQARIMKVTK